MNAPYKNPETRAEAKQMLLDVLESRQVNGAYLSEFGMCEYLTKEGATCIVGSLLTPEQRINIVASENNSWVIGTVLVYMKDITLTAFGGLTHRELEDMQAIFDSKRNQISDLKTYCQNLA